LDKLRVICRIRNELLKGGIKNDRNDSNRSTGKTRINQKNGLDTLIQIPDSTNEPITIIEAIKAIRGHASDISETGNYIIGGDGIRKVGKNGNEVVYQVKEGK
jgi:hypothetical protein